MLNTAIYNSLICNDLRLSVKPDNDKQIKKNLIKILSDADTMVDTLNNIIGRSLGGDNTKFNTELAKDVLDFQHDFG